MFKCYATEKYSLSKIQSKTKKEKNTMNNSTVIFNEYESTKEKTFNFSVTDFLKKSLNEKTFRIKNPNTKTKSKINDSNRHIKIEKFKNAYTKKAKMLNGKLSYNANNKVKALGQTLKELTLLAKKDKNLLIEKLKEKYHWMNESDIEKIVNLIQSLGKINVNQVASIDLTAGWSCPNANECLVKADKFTGELRYMGCFACYASMHENQYLSSRVLRWYNFDLLRYLTLDEKIKVLNDFMNKYKVIRLHSSGDVYNDEYFQALVESAKMNPTTLIFGYTKMIKYYNAKRPKNLIIIYSIGGKDDLKVNDCTVKSFVNLEKNDSAVCQTKDKYSQSEDFFKIVLGYDVQLNFH